MRRSIIFALPLLLAFGQRADATFVVTFEQEGNNVVATGSGTINTTA